MLAKRFIESYIHEVVEAIQTSTDEYERDQLTVLGKLLLSNKLIIESMVNEFDLDVAPNIVLLFDKERCKFWKQSQYGYTDSISDAGIFELEDAKRIAKQDYSNNTKIVWF